MLELDSASDGFAIYNLADLLARLHETQPAAPQDANSDAEETGEMKFNAASPYEVYPPAGTIPAAPTLDVDADGVAYDAAIHSSTRSKTIDGRWKARRNRTGAAPPPPVPTATTDAPPPPVPGTPPPPPPVPTVAPELVVVAAIPPPPDVPPVTLPGTDADDTDVPPIVPAGPPPRVMDFPTFITKITTGMQPGNGLTQARIDEVLKSLKIESLFSLNGKQALIDAASAAFGFVA